MLFGTLYLSLQVHAACLARGERSLRYFHHGLKQIRLYTLIMYYDVADACLAVLWTVGENAKLDA